MSVSELSSSTQNYLKAIWTLGEWSSAPVTPTLIAERTGLRLSSVSDAVRKLSSQGLVNHAPYGAVELTATGREYALAMVRRHRLIESFLVHTLDYTWDEVHDEAEHLEHAVSDLMIDRIDAFLEYPTRDPHGDPIPRADGTVDMPDATRLTDIDSGTVVRVERISDADPTLLDFLAGHGIVIGSVLETGDGAAFSEALDVRLRGTTATLPLGRTATDALYVSIVTD